MIVAKNIKTGKIYGAWENRKCALVGMRHVPGWEMAEVELVETAAEYNGTYEGAGTVHKRIEAELENELR